MNIENEYKEFNDYWNETIKGDSWTTLERQACFMGWIEAKKRALNLYNVRQQSEQFIAFAKFAKNYCSPKKVEDAFKKWKEQQ